MKLFNKFLILSFSLLALACNKQPEDNGKSLTLSVSKTEISADGSDKAVFTVKTNKGNDVTSSAMIICTTDNSAVRNAEFSTTAAGSYSFVASIDDVKSNEVRVNATQAGPVDDNDWITTDVKTPIRYAEGNYYGTSTSTGIEVSVAEAGQLKFTCTPGEDVESYRVMFYPLSYIYNSLSNLLVDGVEELTTEDAEELLMTLLTQDAYPILQGVLCNSELESLGSSYYSYEFDWRNGVNEMAWPIQADADYLVVTLSSFDKECLDETNFADMAICHVHTPAVPLVGNPQVDIQVFPDYTSYRVLLEPNEDCHLLYYLSHTAEQIDGYISLYGEKMYRDLLRHYGSIVSEDMLPYHYSSSGIIENDDYTVTAVALDVNGNPAEKINRKDFRLLVKPKDAVIGKADFTNFKTASTLARFDVEMDEYTACVYQSYYLKSEAEKYMNADEETKNSIISQLVDGGGWWHGNDNFSFDKVNNVPTGSAGVDDIAYWDALSPETEYAILYVTCNAYGDLSELQMTESFKTKALNRTMVSDADPDFKFNITASDVTSLTFNLEFNPETVAQVRFGCYYPAELEYEADAEGHEYPNESSSRENWLYWMFDFADSYSGGPWFDACWGTIDMPEGKESYVMTGLNPGMHYKYACVYEDWEGNVSKIYWAEANTQNLSYGPNPELETDVTRDERGNYHFEFIGNGHVGKIHKFGIGSSDEVTATSLGLEYLIDKEKYLKEDDFLKMARRELTGGTAMTSDGNYTTWTTNASELEKEKIYVIIAHSEGKDSDGNPVYSDIEYYVWTPDMDNFLPLHEYLSE